MNLEKNKVYTLSEIRNILREGQEFKAKMSIARIRKTMVRL